MKIAVLNGSPKGETSVTVQYVRFLRKSFPRHEFTLLNVCQDIKRLEGDEGALGEVLATLEAADGLLWATPVYVMLVPGPYKRFIELLLEHNARAPLLRGKYAAALTTSVRFFDHTAHDYLSALSDDLDMRFVGSYSAEMYDLLKVEEQQRLALFGEQFLRAIETRAPAAPRHRPIEHRPFDYAPGEPDAVVSAGARQVLVVTDARDEDHNLRRMVERFCRCFRERVEVVNLHEINIRGGCMGCIQCGQDNVCAYGDADDVRATYEKLRAADIVVEAGAVHDRFLSARWKTFWDRAFYNNHVPMLVGKQTAFLVSGPLMQLPGLREVLEASGQLQQANLAGIVTDEGGDSPQLDRLLDDLAARLVACAEAGYVQTPTFLSVGGKKILRDMIYASPRFVFRADHRYYKTHGLYDFPRRSLRSWCRELFISLLLKIPAYRKEFRQRFRSEMIKPLEKVLEDS